MPIPLAVRVSLVISVLPMPIGTAIDCLRNVILGETQQDFGSRFGVTQSVISEAERGAPSRELALAIYDAHAKELEAYGFTFYELLTGKRRRWTSGQSGTPASAA